MTQPNKVIDGIFERFDSLDGMIGSYRRFLAESLIKVLEKVYNTPDADESIANAYDMLKALKENHD